MSEQLELKDTYWKCFLLDKDSNAVYGLVNENETGIGYQWLGNAGNGKFYAMSTHWESKRLFGLIMKNCESTTDYQEAYNHLMSKKNEPSMKTQ